VASSSRCRTSPSTGFGMARCSAAPCRDPSGTTPWKQPSPAKTSCPLIFRHPSWSARVSHRRHLPEHWSHRALWIRVRSIPAVPRVQIRMPRHRQCLEPRRPLHCRLRRSRRRRHPRA